MSSTIAYFKGSFIFTAVAMFAGVCYGMYLNGLSMALTVAISMLALCAVEIALSFDNAIANAKVMKDMDHVWRQRFLTWGMLIAVFGMRVVFPIIIVSFAGDVNLIEATRIGFTDPAKYQELMEKSEIIIAGFGGSFLMLVALGFFFDREKDISWVHALEDKLHHLGRLNSAEIVVTASLALIFATNFLHGEEQIQFIIASVVGIIVHELVGSIGEFMGDDNAAARTGVGAFIYLEVLDASFSFDGVIGAFAITNDIVIIALGLGIGAMFVRSLTIMLVDKGSMSEYRYLEHGAFWSILVLAIVMYAGTVAHIPEWAVAISAIGTIAASYYSSLKANKAEELS